MTRPTAKRPTLLLAVLLGLLQTSPAAAETEPAADAHWLPTNPRAAAFLLARRSDAELSALLASARFGHNVSVLKAVVLRHSLPEASRRRALARLAKATGDSEATHLCVLLRDAGAEPGLSETAVASLGRLLVSLTKDELRSSNEALLRLTRAETAHVPPWAWAALAMSSTDAELAASRGPFRSALQGARRRDLMLGLAHIPDAKERRRHAPLVEAALAADETARRDVATWRALIACVPGPATIDRLLTIAKDAPKDRFAAAAALAAVGDVPVGQIPPDRLDRYVRLFVRTSRALSPKRRAAEAFRLRRRTVAARLARVREGEHASSAAWPPLVAAVASLDVPRFELRAIRQEMRFDRRRIEVPAGRAIEIAFVNDDDLPQNVVVIRPGRLRRVGAAADAMQGREAFDRGFVPEHPDVLYATGLVEPKSSASLVLTTPVEPGALEFTSTVAEHWRNMHGTLAVVRVKTADRKSARRGRSSDGRDLGKHRR